MKIEIEVKEGFFKSKRFIQVIEGWANGLSYEAIGKQNDIAADTVRDYGKILREEFDAKNQGHVLSKLYAKGIISAKETVKTLAIMLVVTNSLFSDNADAHIHRVHLKSKTHSVRHRNEA